MATVYVGSARIDENGNAHGGKAGDQTTKEVSKQAWYKHSKGWRVFRAKDRKKANIIADQMIAACNNNKIGYDQYERYDLFAEAKKVGFDLSKVNVATECDCSELVRCCCAAAGITDLPTNGFRTGNMPTNLMKTGEFEEMTGTKYTDQSAYLAKGDILVTKTSGHTVVVLNDGDKVNTAPVAYKLGDRTLRQGMTGEDVKELQTRLNKMGHSCGTADGEFGKNTKAGVKAFQKAAKIEIDGIFGKESYNALMEIESGHFEYPVKIGESLWGLAQRFLGKGTRYTEIMELNDLTSTKLRIGQILKIPNK